jgi:hypothetical protein
LQKRHPAKSDALFGSPSCCCREHFPIPVSLCRRPCNCSCRKEGWTTAPLLCGNAGLKLLVQQVNARKGAALLRALIQTFVCRSSPRAVSAESEPHTLAENLHGPRQPPQQRQPLHGQAAPCPPPPAARAPLHLHCWPKPIPSKVRLTVCLDLLFCSGATDSQDFARVAQMLFA